MSHKLMTTSETAAYLGVNDSRVRQLIRDEGLPAEKVGRDWVIRDDLLEVWWKRRLMEQATRRGPGRPIKVPQLPADPHAPPAAPGREEEA